MTAFPKLRIATRQSKLALWQAHYVRQQLLAHYPQCQIELIPMQTRGDNTAEPLQTQGGKSLFVKELQSAMLNQHADIAVHSIKDMSVHDYPGLELAAICQRADSRDVLVSQHYQHLEALPKGATVGTTSPRRQCQLLALRPDLLIKPLRGNINTRLKRAAQGDFDAIVLAAAGLQRLDYHQQIASYFDLEQLIPAIGQGAIGIECRSDDNAIKHMLQALNHNITQYCVTAERAVNRRLGGDCFTPIGVHATYDSDKQHINLNGIVGSLDGQQIIRAQHQQPITDMKTIDANTVGLVLAEELLKKGAADLLNSA